MALWEGRRKGINSFITVDKKSREYLPRSAGRPTSRSSTTSMRFRSPSHSSKTLDDLSFGIGGKSAMETKKRAVPQLKHLERFALEKGAYRAKVFDARLVVVDECG
ncbi:MAG: hypothetical protein U0411_00545 [Thermodesulfovibrionales bacterium]